MIGTQELVIIFIVVALIFKNKDLAKFARSLGDGVASFRNALK